MHRPCYLACVPSLPSPCVPRCLARSRAGVLRFGGLVVSTLAQSGAQVRAVLRVLCCCHLCLVCCAALRVPCHTSDQPLEHGSHTVLPAMPHISCDK